MAFKWAYGYISQMRAMMFQHRDKGNQILSITPITQHAHASAEFSLKQNRFPRPNLLHLLLHHHHLSHHVSLQRKWVVSASFRVETFSCRRHTVQLEQ